MQLVARGEVGEIVRGKITSSDCTLVSHKRLAWNWDKKKTGKTVEKKYKQHAVPGSEDDGISEQRFSGAVSM